MANSRLPYDDEEQLDQDTLDLIEGEQFQEEDLAENYKNADALKYIANSDTSTQPEGYASLVGQIVGKSKSTRDPFQPPPEIVAQKEQASVEQQDPKVKEYEDILNLISQSKQPRNELAEVQKNVADTNTNLSYGLAANQLAKAIASGYGANIGDGSEVVNMLSKQNQQKVGDYKDRIKDRADDPNSDISKTYRLVVAKGLKQKYPDLDLKQLDNMSANELEALAKNQLDSKNRGRGDLFFTTVKDENGKDIVAAFDRTTGQQIKVLGDKSTADRIFVDTETGNKKVYNQVTGIKDLGTGAPEQITKKTVDENEIKKQQQELKNPLVLKQISPDLYKDLESQKQSFIKDVKDNREVETSSLLLASKLAPGDNSKEFDKINQQLIDSGFLGGIQTQAAKMAGQKGVLTDQDLVKFAGAGGVGASIQRILNGTFFGNMSENDVQFFKLFANKMQKANLEDINNRSKVFVEDIHNKSLKYLPNLQLDTVKNDWFNVNKIAPNAQEKSTDNSDPTIQQYSKQHNLSYEQAKSILTKRGYKPNEKR
jgi:hypothetical protein